MGFATLAAMAYRVVLIPGDGTGPEVTAEAVKVFKAVAALEGIKYELKDFDLGGERYLRTGEILPEEVVCELGKFKAILLGAVGHPDVPPGVLEKGLLLALRFRFDQYINLRPVKLFPGVETPLKDKRPEDIDFVVVRENTEDMYAGAKVGLRPIYDALLDLCLNFADDVKACPCKTIVPLYRNHVIAQIKPTTNTRIDFGLALKGAKGKRLMYSQPNSAKNA